MTRTKRATAVALFAVGVSLCGARSSGAAAADDQESSETKRPTRIIIFPILVQAPVFGAEIDLPALPSVPGGGGGGGEAGPVTGKTDVSLNAAYMAGVSVETDRVFVEAAGTYAALTANRQTPRINVKTDTLFFSGRAGVRLFDGISATAGVRHFALDITGTLTLPNAASTISGETKPGFWDPLIGVDYRTRPGRFQFQANFQGGGFGVGTDVDLTAEARFDIRFAKVVELRLGYSFLYYKATVANVSIGQYQRQLVSKQSLNGPSLGFGIVF